MKSVTKGFGGGWRIVPSADRPSLREMRAQEKVPAVCPEQIETRPDILAGEPVLKGTRMPARHVADMLRQGATVDEIVEEFDLTPEQVSAAEVFDRTDRR